MAAKKPAFDSQGNLIVTLDKPYTFRSPKGRDLATIQRSLKDDDMVSVEIMAAIVAALSLDGLTYDSALDLPAEILSDLGGAVMSNFRVFSIPSV
jgi:hypothetical protein